MHTSTIVAGTTRNERLLLCVPCPLSLFSLRHPRGFKPTTINPDWEACTLLSYVHAVYKRLLRAAVFHHGSVQPRQQHTVTPPTGDDLRVDRSYAVLPHMPTVTQSCAGSTSHTSNPGKYARADSTCVTQHHTGPIREQELFKNTKSHIQTAVQCRE